MACVRCEILKLRREKIYSFEDFEVLTEPGNYRDGYF